MPLGASSTLASPQEVMFSVSRCHDSAFSILQGGFMLLDSVTRRKFAGRFAAIFSATGAATVFSRSASARTGSHNDYVRKLIAEGKPHEGKPFNLTIVAYYRL